MTYQKKQNIRVDKFQTDLFIPEYHEAHFENWKIEKMVLGHDYGYYSGVHMVENMPILCRKNPDTKEWESWMAISPHEIESQQIGCKYAFGNTVIMGLGMGWVTINAAFNPEVSKVTVIELDKNVIELIRETKIFNSLPQNILDKINIVNDNALLWKSKEKVDFLYADIWLNLNEPQVLEEVFQMQKNLNAEKIYYWGQEFALYNLYYKKYSESENISLNKLQDIVENKIKLPLLLPDDINYSELMRNVIANRKKRNLTY